MNGPNRPPAATCLSDLRLDRLVAEGCDPGSEPHLATCSDCAARLGLFAQAQQTAAPAVERALAAAQETRRRAPTGRQRRRLVMPAAFVATAAFAATLLLVWVQPKTPEVETGIRTKGTAVRFFVKHRGQTKVVPGRSGETLGAGDALRFVISTPESGFFILLGIQSTSQPRAYFPFDGHQSVSVAPGTDAPLPGSLILDETEETEHFLGIFTAEPLSLERIAAAIAAKRASGEPLPTHLDLPGQQHWVVIHRRR